LGKLYEQALALLTAHRMKMAGNFDAAADSDEGSSLSSVSIAESLRIASYSEGGASISFYNGGGSSSSESGGDLSLTTYGTQYQALRRMVIIPIHCSGEVS